MDFQGLKYEQKLIMMLIIASSVCQVVSGLVHILATFVKSVELILWFVSYIYKYIYIHKPDDADIMLSGSINLCGI